MTSSSNLECMHFLKLAYYARKFEELFVPFSNQYISVARRTNNIVDPVADVAPVDTGVKSALVDNINLWV